MCETVALLSLIRSKYMCVSLEYILRKSVCTGVELGLKDMSQTIGEFHLVAFKMKGQ